MNLKDILELAKQGYKPSDIKELIELSKEDPKEDPKDDPKKDPKEDPKGDPKKDPKDDPKEDPKDNPKEDPKDNPKDKKIAELQKLLQNKDVSSEEKIRTSRDVLNELFKNL